MRKQRKSTLWYLLAVLVLMMSVFTAKVLAVEVEGSEAGITVMLHYHRPDENYDDWDLWSWPAGKDGQAYAFEPEESGVVAVVPVSAGVTSIGYIVRKGGNSWSSKDVSEDQFLSFPEVKSGTLHVYVESGVPNTTLEYGEDVVVANRVSEASYNRNTGAIVVVLTGPLDDPQNAFALFDADGNSVAIAETDALTDRTFTLLPAEEIDLFSAYTLSFDGERYPVKIPNIYSTEEFEDKYTYTGNDLGATWTSEKTVFRVWAPTAQAVTVNLYESGTEGADDLIESIPMSVDVNGTWVAEKPGDLNGVYYTYTAVVNGAENETVDPYARSVGVNGKRAMVLDLDSTDPDGWDTDENPNANLAYTDAIIYELHIRDLSVDESSGISHKGKFLGLAETGTKTPDGIPTGLDHIKDLGITHVHLLPCYDYGSVDETKLDSPQFNWGYDPVNYNVPEGSYATDPYNGEVRVREMKQMVKALHDQGISVVMDVVYNHVQSAENFSINRLVPGYFSRIKDDGSYSGDSGCGNDTASERSMVRKFIVDSVLYWATEYHIDGFRFDLVGLLDVDTVNEIVESVHAVRPDVIFYGEGWDMSKYVTKPQVVMATQNASSKTPGFAYFSDSIRDDLKGSVFNKDPGFVSGAAVLAGSLTNDFMGSPAWAISPAQVVNYVSCHDNNTLIDRITLSRPDASREDIVRMNNLAAAFYMTSQGIPFMQAGEEMLRSKPNADGTLNENSFNASDEVNSLKWADLASDEVQAVYEYYQGLIAFRKAHPSLRMTDAEAVQANVTAAENLPENVLAFAIASGADGEESEGLYIIFNANAQAQEITLPDGNWDVYITAEKAGTQPLDTVCGTISVEPISALVLVHSGDIPADGND